MKALIQAVSGAARHKVAGRPIRRGQFSAEFWVGHTLMIMATIIGVYLASGEGFRQAVAFTRMHDALQNYHLRGSLLSELEDNLTLIEGFADQLAQGAPYRGGTARPQLDDFVWDTMRNTPATLQTPAEILAATRRYYREVTLILDRLDRRELGSRYAAGELQQRSAQMRAETLPQLQADLEQLQRLLRRHGMVP